MHCIEESTYNIVGAFRSPSDLAPGAMFPPYTPSLRPYNMASWRYS